MSTACDTGVAVTVTRRIGGKDKWHSDWENICKHPAEHVASDDKINAQDTNPEVRNCWLCSWCIGNTVPVGQPISKWVFVCGNPDVPDDRSIKAQDCAGYERL